MKIGMPGLALLAALCLGFAPAGAQTKPPESASKVKKVLLYNKIGGWVSTDGIADVKAVFSALAAAKGFELVQSDSDAEITLQYLKEFQVIVWNNNSGGASSMPSSIARQAVLDYLDQGGGWMLISKASEQADTWPGLAKSLGTAFWIHSSKGRGEVVMDSAADAHRELKWMMQGFPDVFELKDTWLSFYNTVRPLPGITVVATSRAIPGTPEVVIPNKDGNGDNVYIWAREVGQGRMLYNAIGFGHGLMAQQDSIVPRLYWENLRYSAGDYQNGCTTPGSPGFDSAARVHVETMCQSTGLTFVPALPHRVVRMGDRRMQLINFPSGPFTIRIRDIRGTKVWERTVPAGTGEIALDDAIRSGVYLFEIPASVPAFRQRLLVP